MTAGRKVSSSVRTAAAVNTVSLEFDLSEEER